MAYTEPPIRKVAVDRLRLDPENYRFPATQNSDRAAMNYLFQSHGCMAVAKLILRSGYFDNEIPLVTLEDDTYVLLEGNRRVASLRALRDPSLVPAYQSELERLLKRHASEAADLPASIRVMVVDSREEAAPHLARLHVGENKKAWDLDEQAKFVLAQLVDGTDPSMLKTLLPGIPSVSRLIRMGRMRQLLQTSRFSDPEVEEYANGFGLKMSVFEYAYKDPQIQKLMGLSFTRDGNIATAPTSTQEIAVLERVLEGFRSKELSTRKVLNDKSGEGYSELIAELQALASLGHTKPALDAEAGPGVGPADGGQLRSGDATDSPEGVGGRKDSDEPSDKPDTAGKPGKGPNNPDTKTKLTIGFEYDHTSTGITKRLIELRQLHVGNHPIAAAMLMRSIVECAAKEHYAKIKKGYDPNTTLSVVADKLLTDYGKEGSVSHAIDRLKNAKGTGGKPGSTLWFNHIAHNVNFPVSAQDVRDAWQAMMPLVRFLVQ